MNSLLNSRFLTVYDNDIHNKIKNEGKKWQNNIKNKIKRI